MVNSHVKYMDESGIFYITYFKSQSFIINAGSGGMVASLQFFFFYCWEL